LRKGESERALRDLNQALALNPKLADAWYHRGVGCFVKQDFAQALADFDEALRLNPRLLPEIEQLRQEARKRLMLRPKQF
jgi:tetratricopeptide (TPR) repeat protein